MSNDNETPGLRFEEGLGELEQVVGRLESGELPLDEALRAFETGVGLVRMLNDLLTAAEQRVEILTRGPDGSVQCRPADDEL